MHTVPNEGSIFFKIYQIFSSGLSFEEDDDSLYYYNHASKSYYRLYESNTTLTVILFSKKQSPVYIQNHHLIYDMKDNNYCVDCLKMKGFYGFQYVNYILIHFDPN